MVNANEWLERNFSQINSERKRVKAIHIKEKLEGELDLKSFTNWGVLNIYLYPRLDHGKLKIINQSKNAQIIQLYNDNDWLEQNYPPQGICVRENEKVDFWNKTKIMINNFRKSRNQITQLDLSKQQLTGILNLSDFINLEELGCHDNNLTNLILPQNSKLKLLNCNWNGLINLDLSIQVNLEDLQCRGNRLIKFILPIGIELIKISDGHYSKKSTFLSSYPHVTEYKHENTFLPNAYYAPPFISSCHPIQPSKPVYTYSPYIINAIDSSYVENKLNKLEQELKVIDDGEKDYVYVNARKKEFSYLKKLDESNKEIKKLKEQNVVFEEREKEIIYLERRVQELTESIKNQKWKILQTFSRLLPEKELLQELIKSYLDFVKFKKQGLGSTDYRKQLKSYEKKYKEIEDKLEERLSEDVMNEIQQIMTDCEDLAIQEVELESRLKDKTFCLEQQEQTLKQISDNKEEKLIVENHQKTHYQQLQKRNTIEILKLEMAEMKGQMSILIARPTTQQTIISQSIVDCQEIEIKGNFNPTEITDKINHLKIKETIEQSLIIEV
ncbi:MAG: hypothetical protein AM1032_000390 [Mycoplasmataceae bacterium]|nr:MAG: hypothetical protein AM1032_000390 [Mycoplasmataceae bacterium]